MQNKFLVLFLIFVMACSQALAQENVFEVKNVEVYLEADNLDNAMIEAKNKAIKQAFHTLILRMLPNKLSWKVDVLNHEMAFDLLNTQEVISERMTADSYKGRLNIIFNEQKIKSMLSKNGIPFYDKYDDPLLIIPVLYKEGKYSVWVDDDWGRVWWGMPEKIGLSNFVYAEGDLDDNKDFAPKDMFIKNIEDYRYLLEEYEAKDLILIFAEQGDDRMKVTVKRLSATTPWINYMHYTFDRHKSELDNYQKLAENLLLMIDDVWKGQNEFEKKHFYKSELKINSGNPAELNAIKGALAKVKEVQKFDIISMPQNELKLVLFFEVDPGLLAKILIANKLRITADNELIIDK
jgi:hypothetical protein